MRKRMIMLSVALTGSLTFGAFATQPSSQLTNAADSEAAATAVVMSTIKQQQLHQRDIDLAFALIKSRYDLEQYLSTTPVDKSPLRFLPQEKRQQFLDSLQFNSKGLAGFSYTSITSSGLSATQIRNVLRLFGMQGATSALKGARTMNHTDELLMASPDLLDHKDMECSKRATCSPYSGDICTSNC